MFSHCCGIGLGWAMKGKIQPGRHNGNQVGNTGKRRWMQQRFKLAVSEHLNSPLTCNRLKVCRIFNTTADLWTVDWILGLVPSVETKQEKKKDWQKVKILERKQSVLLFIYFFFLQNIFFKFRNFCLIIMWDVFQGGISAAPCIRIELTVASSCQFSSTIKFM